MNNNEILEGLVRSWNYINDILENGNDKMSVRVDNELESTRHSIRLAYWGHIEELPQQDRIKEGVKCSCGGDVAYSDCIDLYECIKCKCDMAEGDLFSKNESIKQEKELIESLTSFIENIEKNTSEVIALLDEDKELVNKYDFTITQNGKSIVIPINADSQETISMMLSDLIKQEKELM